MTKTLKKKLKELASCYMVVVYENSVIREWKLENDKRYRAAVERMREIEASFTDAEREKLNKQ
jgi:hypothetical protein